MTKRLRVRAGRLLRAFITLFAYDVFISYARVDGRKYARRLQRQLERANLVTYLDKSDLLAGDRLDSALTTALHRSRLFVLVATDGARVSPYVAGEVGAYLSRGRPIVPLNFGDSYTRENWPRLSTLNLVWLNEPVEALATGIPSREVVSDLRRHLKSTATRLVTKRLMAAAVALLVALAGGVLWSYAVAREQGHERNAQRLAARAQLGFDIDQNPLLTLGYAAASLKEHDSLEAGDVIARALPYTRRQLAGIKIGRYATRVTFSATGRYLLVIGSVDTLERVVTVLGFHDLTTRIRVQRRTVEAAVMRRQEDLIALADRGDCVTIIAIDTGQTVTCVPSAGVTQVGFSDDGQFMNTVGRERGPDSSPQVVSVWDTKNWQRIAAREVPSFVRGTVFDKDGRKLLIARQVYGTISAGACLWDFRSNGDCAIVNVPPQESMGMSFGAEAADIQFGAGGRPWVASSAIEASLTDVSSGEVRVATALSAPTMIAPNVDGQGPFLITRPPGGVVTLWRTSASAGAIANLIHPGDVRDVRFSPDARTIVTTSDDGIVRLWDAGLRGADQNDFIGSSRLTALLTHGVATSSSQQNRAETIVGVAVAPDSRSVATAGNDGWVRVWRLDAEPGVQRGRHGQWIGGAVRGQTPDTFITASDYYARVWSLNPLREVRRLRKHENDNQGVYISRDGAVIATSGDDGRVQLFDSNFRFVRAIEHDGSERPIHAALADDGSRLVTGASGLVRTWDPRTGGKLGELRVAGTVSALAISPDGAVAAIGGDGRLTLVDSSRELIVRTERQSASPVTALRFDQAGRRLVVGTSDGVVIVSDVRTGKELQRFRHLDRVSAAVFSPDEQLLLTGSYDRTARVWDLRTGTEVARQTRSFRIDAVAFVSGDRLVVAAGQNYVQVSPWRQADLLALACELLGSVGGDSWSRLVGVEVSTAVCANDRMPSLAYDGADFTAASR